MSILEVRTASVAVGPELPGIESKETYSFCCCFFPVVFACMPFPTSELLVLEKKACMTVQWVLKSSLTVTLAGTLG